MHKWTCRQSRQEGAQAVRGFMRGTDLKARTSQNPPKTNNRYVNEEAGKARNWYFRMVRIYASKALAFGSCLVLIVPTRASYFEVHISV